MASKRKSPDAQTGAPLSVVAQNQAELFSPDAYPARPDLVTLVKSKSFIHTAAHLTKDEELCRAVCMDVLSGTMTTRQIAKKYSISRNSIVGIVNAMDRRGELEPIRQRVSELLGDCITLGLENYRDALAANLINPAQLPIPMAALIDKKGQLDGNVIPGTSLQAPELTAADIEREILEMKRVTVVPVETESIDIATKPA